MIPPPLRAATLLLASFLSACAKPAAREHPNVVLISLDTTRRDVLGFQGAPRPTPHLDALAEEAAVFENCQAQSTATAPSHMSILTGMHVQRHGLLKNGETSIPTISLASVLRRAGYHTAAFTGHGSLQGKFGPGFGFDVFVSWPEGQEEAGEGAEYQRSIRDTIREGIAFLDSLPPGAPFFLFLHGYDPHLPYWPPEPLREEYAGWYRNDLKIAALHNHASMQPMLEDGTIGEPELRYLRDLYAAEVRASDEAIGEFLDALAERDLIERSIVVFLSDHGEAIGEHDWIGHGMFHEEILAVPFLIRFPHGQWAGRYETPIEHIDLAPTVLEALGIAAPAGMQGMSLLPILRGEAEDLGEDRMRVSQRAHGIGLSFADAPGLRIYFRRTPSGPENLEVFDLSEDPGEENDLSQDPDFRDRWVPRLERYLEWTRVNVKADRAFRGKGSGIREEDKGMLRALGYLGEQE